MQESLTTTTSELRESAPADSTLEPQTLWERAAVSRWGRYLTEVEQQAILKAHHSFPHPGAGLEVGCEGGRWCRLLTSLGWQMTGTDVKPEALRLCEERSPGVRCILVDKNDTSLPVDDHSIDLLLLMEVPTVTEAPWFSAEADRVLKSAGVVVGNYMNQASWRGIATNAKSALLGNIRYYNSSYSDFRREMQERGFTFIHERGYGWAPFSRFSNSRLVPLATACETSLGLYRLLTVSPWVAFVAARGALGSTN